MKKLHIIIILLSGFCSVYGQTYKLNYDHRPTVNESPAYTTPGWNFDQPTLSGPVTVTATFENFPAVQDITTWFNEESMMFGATSRDWNTGGKFIVETPAVNGLGSIGVPSSSFFSAANDQIGTGILTDGPESFHTGAFVQYTSVEYLALQNEYVTAGEQFDMGTVTYTFSHPVDNPVIHISGLGGISRTGTSQTDAQYLWFSTELQLTGSSVNYNLRKLSGTVYTERNLSEVIFDVDATGKKIVNRWADNFSVLPDLSGTTRTEAASGSAIIEGEDITQVTFKVWLRAKTDGRWTQDNMYAGDQYNVSFTFNESICTKPPATGESSKTFVGITTLDRNTDNWLSDEKNENQLGAYLVLESATKPFVITRNDNPGPYLGQDPNVPGNIPEPVQGMVVWDSAKNCLSLFDGTYWKCVNQDCNQ